ncbi:MAG TPA: potassium transporter TrkG, partial [Limnochordia bacterium]|nr:potassium transporter TrkG [Limnochordia bacterium]
AVLCALLVLGGLGFTVIGELSRSLKPRNWSFHTKVVMATTAILLMGGTALIWLSEYTSQSMFVHMPWYERGAQALFLSVTARTAGFATFDLSKLGSATLLFMILLMFIGASPNSTGGGVKTTTFAALLLSMASTLSGKRDVTLFGRRMPVEAIRRATAISLLAGMWIAGALILLTLAEPAIDFIKLFFEVVSAFGTVGLSTGITPHLNPPARIVLMLTMFAGRVGLLTLLLALTPREPAEIRYPEAPLSVG